MFILSELNPLSLPTPVSADTWSVQGPQHVLDPGLFPAELYEWDIDFRQGCTLHTSGRAVVSSTVLFTRHSSGQLSVLLQGPLLSVMDYFQWSVVLWQHEESYITTFFSISGAASSPKQSSSSPKGYCALSPQINRVNIIPDCQQRPTSNLRQFQ